MLCSARQQEKPQCVCCRHDMYSICASQNDRRNRDELGFDYIFESHDGIQAPPFIYFENGKPVSKLKRNVFGEFGKWSWEKAEQEKPRYALDFKREGDSGWLPSFEQEGDYPDGPAKSELTCGKASECTSGGGSGHHFARYGYEGFSTTHTGEVYIQAAANFIYRATQQRKKPFFLEFASQGVHTPHTPPHKFFGEDVRGTQETPHLDMVREVDLQLKELMLRLDRNKVTSNTLVIFTSDNGGLNKSEKEGHRASGTLHNYKGTDWEGGHRVPFFVRWPGVTPHGLTCDQPMVLTDLFATFAELTGRSKHEDSKTQGMDSTSIYQHLVNTETACGLNGNSPVPREAVLVQQTRNDPKGTSGDILTGSGQTMVAVSQDHLKVVANRYKAAAGSQRLSEVAQISKEFRYVDLGVIERMPPATQTEKQASTLYKKDTRAPEPAAKLYLELRRKMCRVRDGLRTTPPLARDDKNCHGLEDNKKCKIKVCKKTNYYTKRCAKDGKKKKPRCQRTCCDAGF